MPGPVEIDGVDYSMEQAQQLSNWLNLEEGKPFWTMMENTLRMSQDRLEAQNVDIRETDYIRGVIANVRMVQSFRQFVQSAIEKATEDETEDAEK